MAEEVFEDTPFAGYLRNVGAEDWGIEDADELDLYSAESHPKEPSVASETPETTSNTTLRPLLLSERVSHTKKERFRGLLRSALSQKLSAQETGEFLEQFRYTIMSSDLLRDLPLYTSWSASTDERRRALLFDTKKPWTILKQTNQSHLIGGGGCIIAISALLHWRSGRSSISEKEQIALIMGLLAVLYLFATSRRRLLRSLRKKALLYMEDFIVSSKQFDGDIVRALRSLQELEVVSAGFAPNGKPPYQTHTTGFLGQKLRAVLASSLHLISEAYIDAVKDCASMGATAEIEQFFEMFGLREQQSNLGFEFSNDLIGYNEPITSGDSRFTQVSELKQALRKAHLARRVFLCCTLAVPSTGECRPAELETWTVLTDHLLNCSQLAHQMSNVITKERLSPVASDPGSSLSQGNTHPASRNLIEMAATVRHLNARLELMQSAFIDHEEYERHEHAIGAEVLNLTEEWQRLRTRKERPHPIPVASSPTVVAMTPQSDDMSTFTAFAPPDLTDSATEVTDDSVQPTAVWESVVPASLVPPRSMLGREERIRQMQESREQQAAQKSLFDSRSSLAYELDNVFRHRPHGTRG